MAQEAANLFGVVAMIEIQRFAFRRGPMADCAFPILLGKQAGVGSWLCAGSLLSVVIEEADLMFLVMALSSALVDFEHVLFWSSLAATTLLLAMNLWSALSVGARIDRPARFALVGNPEGLRDILVKFRYWLCLAALGALFGFGRRNISAFGNSLLSKCGPASVRTWLANRDPSVWRPGVAVEVINRFLCVAAGACFGVHVSPLVQSPTGYH